MPPAAESERRPKRIAACDRCRAHKLRCERNLATTTWLALDNIEASKTCVRCARAGSKCTTSAPQRLGRPPRQLYGQSSAMYADRGDAVISSAPPETESTDMLADLGFSAEAMQHMEGFRELYTESNTVPSTPLTDADSYSYEGLHCSIAGVESQAGGTSFSSLLDQQLAHWEARGQLQSDDELDDLFLAFSGSSQFNSLDWSSDAGNQALSHGGTTPAVSQSSSSPTRSWLAAADMTATVETSPATTTTTTTTTTTRTTECSSQLASVQPHSNTTPRTSISGMSGKACSGEQSVRNLSLLISKLSQSLEDIQAGLVPAFDVAITCADDFLKVLDELSEPPSSSNGSMDSGASASLNASQALLLLNCHIKIVAIFRAGYKSLGALSSTADISPSDLATLTGSSCLAMLPFRNRGLQLSIIIHQTLYVLSRADEVLKLGSLNSAVRPLVQATMRCEDLQGNICGLLRDMQLLRKMARR